MAHAVALVRFVVARTREGLQAARRLSYLLVAAGNHPRREIPHRAANRGRRISTRCFFDDARTDADLVVGGALATCGGSQMGTLRSSVACRPLVTDRYARELFQPGGVAKRTAADDGIPLNQGTADPYPGWPADDALP